jgi:hypothetical protein
MILKMAKYIFLLSFIILSGLGYSQGGNTCSQALSNPLSIGSTVMNTTCGQGNDFGINTPCTALTPINANDYVYAVTPTSNGMVTVNISANLLGGFTVNNMYSTTVVYQGCPGLSNCITSNFAILTGSFASSYSLAFEVIAGTTYFILVDGWRPQSGWADCYNFILSTTIQSNIVNTGCANSGFNNGLTGWNGSIGNAVYNTIGQPIPLYSPLSSVIGPPRIVINNTFTNTCLPFTVVSPLGGNFVRLGRDVSNREANRLTYTFIVTPGSTSFTYAFLPILEEPGHMSHEQPFFEAQLILPNNTILQCSRYIVAAAQGLTGYVNSTTCSNVIYRPWSLVNIDLTNYVGQTVTIRFTSGGCAQSGHWGYTYIDYQCSQSPLYTQPQNIQICPGDQVTLSAPPGYQSYQWLPLSVNTQNINFFPIIGNIITLNLTSSNGCVITRQYTISQLPCCTNSSNIQIHEN